MRANTVWRSVYEMRYLGGCTVLERRSEVHT
jgi:hypothetical protein